MLPIQETASIFDTFAGAIVAQDNDGQQKLFDWVKKLVSVP